LVRKANSNLNYSNVEDYQKFKEIYFENENRKYRSESSRLNSKLMTNASSFNNGFIDNLMKKKYSRIERNGVIYRSSNVLITDDINTGSISQFNSKPKLVNNHFSDKDINTSSTDTLFAKNDWEPKSKVNISNKD